MKYFAVVLVALFFQNAQAYKAAVLEYYPSFSNTPNHTIVTNLNEYRGYVSTARSQAVDIIVFPEAGLTGLSQNPEQYAIEIDTTHHVIKELQSMALEHQMYLVVNLLEKVQDTSGPKYYNTDLVFSKNGSIIKKYRKINLFHAHKLLTAGAEDQDPTFTTEFGVTFAIFTCFDILFRNPSRTVLENTDVTDVVFPTAWISMLPFYSSLSVHLGYVQATGVNLLAANYAQPEDARGGSGIYLADGQTAETYIGDTPSSKLIVRDVPNRTTRQNTSVCSNITPFGLPGSVSANNVSNYVTKKIFMASDYQFEDIDVTQKNVSTIVCDRHFCCAFDLVINTTSQISSNIYKVMAFDGLVDYDTVKAHIRVCSLVACENDAFDSCGARINATTKFSKITVSGTFETDKTTFYTPIALNHFLLPLTQTKYCDTNNATDSTFVKLTTVRAQEGVLVFGILGKTDALVDTPEVTTPEPEPRDDNTDSAGRDYALGVLVLLSVIKCVWF